MIEPDYQNLLAPFLRYPKNEDTQLWIIIDRVSDALGINAYKMNEEEATRLWDGLGRLITLMLENGFYASDVGPDNAWPEQDPAQVMTRIRNTWVELKGKFPDVGFIVWLVKK